MDGSPATPKPESEKNLPSEKVQKDAQETMDVRAAAIAEKVREARQKSSYSQEYCAKLVHVSGVTFRAMEWGTGRAFSLPQLECLMELLNIKHDEIWPPERFGLRPFEITVPAGQKLQVILVATKATK